jgi:DNA-directed RNA polymerase subunit RPC12/RpoP
MPRRDLSKIKPLVQRHNTILREYGFSLRRRRWMINSYNHVRVSLNTLYRWDQEDLKNRTAKSPKKSNIDLEWRCTACNGMLVFDQEKEELACNQCGLVVETIHRVKVDHETQIEQFQPTLFSSFNRGLGTSQPEPFICWIIKHAGSKKHKLTSYQVRGRLYKLRPYISAKDNNAKLNEILQHLTRRVREIEGFDPTSDRDSQFVTLDELGRFLSRAKECLEGRQFSAEKLVDALLVRVLGEDGRQIIEAPRKHLRCPRCREETAYAPDKDGKLVLCVECGKAVPAEKAKFKIRYRPIEQKYRKTIERLLATVPVPPEPQKTVRLAKAERSIPVSRAPDLLQVEAS